MKVCEWCEEKVTHNPVPRNYNGVQTYLHETCADAMVNAVARHVNFRDVQTAIERRIHSIKSEQDMRQRDIAAAVDRQRLFDRRCEMFELYCFSFTLDEIGDLFEMSGQRVQQIFQKHYSAEQIKAARDAGRNLNMALYGVATNVSKKLYQESRG